MAGLLYRLGRTSARHRILVVAAWALVLGLAGGAYALFGGALSSAITIPGTPTAKVTDQLARDFPSASGGSGTVVFSTTDGSAFTDAQRTAIGGLLTTISGYDHVKAVRNPFDTQTQVQQQEQQLTSGEQQLEQAQQQLDTQKAQLEAGAAQLPAAQVQAAQQQLQAGQEQLDAQKAQLQDGQTLLRLSSKAQQVSSDGSAAIGTVQFDVSNYEVPPATKTRIVDAAGDAGIQGVRVDVSSDIAQGIPSIVGPGEVVGLVVAAIALLVMLGTAIGAGMPLIGALVGVGAGSLTSLSFSGIVEFISVTPVLGVMLGLAVGIDYALFIINRHRRQLKQGMEVQESIGLATGTSGNAVVFAGSTVLVALVALNVTGVPFLGLMGTVGAVGVLFAVLVAITLIPALLSFAGMRILRKKERASIGQHHAAHALPARTMPTWRAIVTVVAGIAVLAVVALPALSMRLGLPVGSSEPTDSTQYRAYTTIAEKFGDGANGPLLVVADLPQAPSDDAALTAVEADLATRIAARSDVAAVAPIGASENRRTVAFQVVPDGGPSAVSTERLVRDLRGASPLQADAGSVSLGVAGNASGNIDVSTKLADALPTYLALVVGLSLIILIIVFRSLLVPLTATIGFVLSLLAAFGGLTAIYQFGWLSAVFGVHDPGPILSFLPIIEIGILFGLAMDYQLFLVSGMREAYAHGAPARQAVGQGLRAGRAVVTAAAIIMISVFSGFIFSESAEIRPIGFGLAFGVLVDAFVVRMLVIPAAMHLLGRAAWWLPKWLARILPDVDVEGAKLERTHPAPGEVRADQQPHASHGAHRAEPARAGG